MVLVRFKAVEDYSPQKLSGLAAVCYWDTFSMFCYCDWRVSKLESSHLEVSLILM